MTINVAVVTSDALVLGCDSIASTTEWRLDPFSAEMSDGTSEGEWTVKFRWDHLEETVTNAWGGVTKMFRISDWPPVAAVTSGLAKLSGLSISSHASDFLAQKKAAVGGGGGALSVKEIASQFLAFIRERYDENYQNSSLPEPFRTGPTFLIGGYGTTEKFPSVFLANVQGNDLHEHYANGRCGVAWSGQSDAVERVLRGYDTQVRQSIEGVYQNLLMQYRDSVAQSVAAAMERMLKANPHLMGAEIVVPDPPGMDFAQQWEARKLNIQFSNLPLQDAVDLAAFLVNLQSGRAKFGSGVATVGGRTHIGIITKPGGFQMLDEPEIKHLNTGFLS